MRHYTELNGHGPALLLAVDWKKPHYSLRAVSVKETRFFFFFFWWKSRQNFVIGEDNLVEQLSEIWPFTQSSEHCDDKTCLEVFLNCQTFKD